MSRCSRALWGLAVILLLAGCAPLPPPSAATPSPAHYSLAGGGACVHLGATPHPPYANIPVGHDGFAAHAEPMLAENPHNPLQLVGGSKFFPDVAHYRFQIGYYASSDGGCTWTTGTLLPGFSSDTVTSDVTFAFGPHNEVYASVLTVHAVFVLVSHDGGKTFGAPVTAVAATDRGQFVDKPWLAVDPQSGAVVMVTTYDRSDCGTLLITPCGHIAFVRSSDGGKTFSAPREIEGSSPFCSNQGSPGLLAGYAQRCLGGTGATPVCGPQGQIAVAYLYANLDTHASYQLVVTSTDGGTTWSAPVAAAPVHAVGPHLPGQRYRVASLPAFASDAHSGTLYLAWADQNAAHGDGLLVTTSHDFGRTWSAALRVNDSPPQLLVNDSQPQLAIAPSGVVSLSFFDTRNDPAGHLIDVYLTQSVDQGASWRPNVRVTTSSFDPDVQAPFDSDQPDDPDRLAFIGDYQGLAADDRFVHPFWNDTRSGHQVIFTAAIPSVGV